MTSSLPPPVSRRLTINQFRKMANFIFCLVNDYRETGGSYTFISKSIFAIGYKPDETFVFRKENLVSKVSVNLLPQLRVVVFFFKRIPKVDGRRNGKEGEGKGPLTFGICLKEKRTSSLLPDKKNMSVLFSAGSIGRNTMSVSLSSAKQFKLSLFFLEQVFFYSNSRLQSHFVSVNCGVFWCSRN